MGMLGPLGRAGSSVARERGAARHGLAVRLHADQLSDLGGAALASAHGARSADHLEYASLAGVAAMAERGVTAVVLPGAFYFLGETQPPPIDAFRRNGVPIAVATDLNPGSSPVASHLRRFARYEMILTFPGT